MIRAVLFDADGCLIDACQLHRTAFAMAVESVTGYHVTPEDEQKLEGLPTRNKLLVLSNQGSVEHLDFDRINARKQYLTKEMIPHHIRYSEPIAHMFRCLRRKGIKIGIVTNCTRDTVELMLRLTGASDYDVLITNEDVEHPKPDPEGLVAAMTALDMGLDREDVIYVGDNPVDAKAAIAAEIDNYIHVSSPNQVCYELLRCRVSKY